MKGLLLTSSPPLSTDQMGLSKLHLNQETKSETFLQSGRSARPSVRQLRLASLVNLDLLKLSYRF